jgi:thiamine-monophosphate kinase
VTEFDLIELIRARCALARGDVRLGIGDDAALLAVPSGQLLAVSTDTLVEGIHFPKDTAPADLGWKALAVNLSDLAAMGATPTWATLALTLPQGDRAWVGEFADGFAALAREHQVALVGGDTTRGPLSITVTVHGFVREDVALRRAAAQIGDIVCVTGTLGDAAAGLRLLCSPDGRGESGYLIARLNRPTPRIAQGLILAGRAHACIDLSDGLVADLGHICRASQVGAEIDADALPTSPALAALFDQDSRRAFQLAGGDDYELCFTAPEARVDALLTDLARSGCAATRVGRVVVCTGVRVHDASGEVVDTPRAGWQHFAA